MPTLSERALQALAEIHEDAILTGDHHAWVSVQEDGRAMQALLRFGLIEIDGQRTRLTPTGLEAVKAVLTTQDRTLQ